MKTIFLSIGFFLCMMSINAQEIDKQPTIDYTKDQTLHHETLMLQRINGYAASQVIQIGDNNLVNVESQQMQVQQTGEHQLLYYTESSKLIPSNLNVNMEGINNYIEVYGNNSIIENMSINVQGNDRSIIIRNY